MSDSTPKTTAEVLARVDQAWTALESTVARLKPAQLTDVRDPAGWAVKDHLMHVAAWEDAFLARLAGRPTHEALGVDEATLSQDEDTENAAIFARHRHRPLADVLDAARASHRAARARLAALGDRAVAGTVGGRRPARRRRETASPAAAWIAREHVGALRGASRLDPRAGRRRMSRARAGPARTAGPRGARPAGYRDAGPSPDRRPKAGRGAGGKVDLERVEDAGDHPVVAGERHELDQPLTSELGLGARELIRREPVRSVDRAHGVDDEGLSRPEPVRRLDRRARPRWPRGACPRGARRARGPPTRRGPRPRGRR